MTFDGCFPPSLKSFLSLSVGITQQRPGCGRPGGLMFWILGVNFLSLPQPWASVWVKWINRWVFYLSGLIPLTYTFPIFPLKRFTGGKIILFHTVWACSGSSLRLYDVCTEWNIQTQDSMFLMSAPDSLCIILYTHSALHICYLRNIWDLHEHLK